MKQTPAIWILTLLAGPAAFGQAVGPGRPALAPTITIEAAATGVAVQNRGSGNASVDLGRLSYFMGSSAPGQSSRKNPGSLVVSTRFALRVECPGSPASAKVDITMSRSDAADSHALAIDGTPVDGAPRAFAQALPCGSGGEHRLDVEVPVSTPAGSIGSTVAFVATLRK